MQPKIFTDNIIPNPKVSLSYLSSPILSPPTREHLFLTLHNLLLTRVRKKRLKIDTDDNCAHCKQAPEDIQHIFHCPASQPAVNWMRRKIDGIAPELAKENHFSIFTLNFSIVDSNRKFSVIWLVANFLVPSGTQELNPVIISLQECWRTWNQKLKTWRKPSYIPIAFIHFNVLLNSSGQVLFPLFELLNPATATPYYINYIIFV